MRSAGTQILTRPPPQTAASSSVDCDVFDVDATGKIASIKKTDDSNAEAAVLAADGDAWRVKFATDGFNNHCVNHEHDRNATCIKYARKNLSEQQQLCSNKMAL